MRAPCPLLTMLFAALQALGLGACDKLRSTTIVRTVDDGIRHDRSWSRTWKDRAEFRCIASSSGRCNIVVFTSECHGIDCRTRVLTELSLPPGTSRRLDRLPRGFRHCVAHDAKPIVPTCLKA